MGCLHKYKSAHLHTYQLCIMSIEVISAGCLCLGLFLSKLFVENFHSLSINLIQYLNGLTFGLHLVHYHKGVTIGAEPL